jgi:anti-sigma regulatory factor (Ser/Thr protein kinase)
VASVGTAPAHDELARLPIADGDTAIAAAREFAARTVRGWQVGESNLFDVQLLVSELVTNARRHGAPPAELRLRRVEQGILIEVHDSSSVLPKARDAGPAEDTGRGLRLVAGLSERWGTRPDVDGKSVWCTVRMNPSES